MVLLALFLGLICSPVGGKRRRVTPAYPISATRRGGAETYLLRYQYNHKVAKVNIRFSTFTILLVALLMFGCATSEKVRMAIHEGMSKDELKHQHGELNGFKRVEDYTVYTYANRLI